MMFLTSFDTFWIFIKNNKNKITKLINGGTLAKKWNVNTVAFHTTKFDCQTIHQFSSETSKQ
jgi:hypothetical protein